MPIHQPINIFSSKRTFSIVPRHQPSQSKLSQIRQNEFSQRPSTKKYLNTTQKQLPEIDQTQKFLAETKHKLDSSAKSLLQFHYKRQAYKSAKQNISFAILSKQIKDTKQKLKNKHFIGLRKDQSTKIHLQATQTVYYNEENQKLCLIEKVLTHDEFVWFKEELARKRGVIRKQYKDRPELQKKLIQYQLNYQVISRFLEEVGKDTEKLFVKKENIELYYKMKEEMIGLLSNDEFFKAHNNEIEQSEQKRKRALLIKTIHQQQRFAKTYSMGKNANGSIQKTLTEKIEELLETSKDSIKQALFNFNRPYLMYEIELQFNKRLNEANLNE